MKYEVVKFNKSYSDITLDGEEFLRALPAGHALFICDALNAFEERKQSEEIIADGMKRLEAFVTVINEAKADFLKVKSWQPSLFELTAVHALNGIIASGNHLHIEMEIDVAIDYAERFTQRLEEYKADKETSL